MMARHVWLSKKFQPHVVQAALNAAKVARQKVGLDYELATLFVGYYLETLRQSGLKPTFVGDQVNGIHFKYRNAVDDVMARAVRSDHKYAKGHNRNNYLKAGGMVLAQAAKMEPDTPIAAVWDKLADDGLIPL